MPHVSRSTFLSSFYVPHFSIPICGERNVPEVHGWWSWLQCGRGRNGYRRRLQWTRARLRGFVNSKPFKEVLLLLQPPSFNGLFAATARQRARSSTWRQSLDSYLCANVSRQRVWVPRPPAGAPLAAVRVRCALVRSGLPRVGLLLRPALGEVLASRRSEEVLAPALPLALL